MLVSSLSFSIMQVFVKLSSEEVGTFEQTFFRNLVSLIIAAVMVRRENLQVFQEIKRGGWALWGRSFFGFLGIVLFFYAAGHARQADVAMLNRASPVFVTLLAGIFLKEKITPVKIASTILCLVGAYIAMQPSFDSNPFPLLAALLAAVVSGMAYTMLSYCKNFICDYLPLFRTEYGLRRTDDAAESGDSVSKGIRDAFADRRLCGRGTVLPDIRLSAGPGL